MKKLHFLLVSLASLLFLGACGTGVTKEELVNGALDNDISSFEADMKMGIDVNANGQKMNQSLDMTMEYVKEPFNTHIKMSTVDGNIELYMDEETSYALVPGESQWIKTPTNSNPDFAELASGESMKDELNRLKKFVELFEMTQSGNDYVLTVNLTEDSKNKQEIELVQDVLKEATQNSEVEDLQVNSFDYKLTISEDKMLKSIVTRADVDVKIAGETAQIVTDATATYKNVNQVENIAIPAEVTDNAVEMQ
ncbi:DUF6612 family protein [Bacillus marinisedimentorum]|uniref:DUF6612 family protein n=1 Tax=Bacillus marinisedimentorum TaxID=1821260 RepID=UPI0008723BAA|nr:DUF6612 family protein [Bacillus marinisedimentorum]